TTDHTFAMRQLEAFGQAVESLRGAGIDPPLLHTACTAAALLFPETAFGMLRVGIGAYGLWPSKETRVSRHGPGAPELRPVMTWKTRLSEVKDVPVGVTVGYGRTYKTTRPTRLGVLPVGYANGYDRG